MVAKDPPATCPLCGEKVPPGLEALGKHFQQCAQTERVVDPRKKE